MHDELFRGVVSALLVRRPPPPPLPFLFATLYSLFEVSHRDDVIIRHHSLVPLCCVSQMKWSDERILMIVEKILRKESSSKNGNYTLFWRHHSSSDFDRVVSARFGTSFPGRLSAIAVHRKRNKTFETAFPRKDLLNFSCSCLLLILLLLLLPYLGFWSHDRSTDAKMQK